ncbi:MAG: hypothetical protein M0026_07715 [Nocardiopsaceae bacterium]|nr:hypothetical protein [Nocardiopsaceae bacterium]
MRVFVAGATGAVGRLLVRCCCGPGTWYAPGGAFAAALGAPAPPPTEGRRDWARGAVNHLARSHGWRPERPTWRTGFAAQGT